MRATNSLVVTANSNCKGCGYELGVDDGCAVRGQVFADGEDLFALDQHVGRAGSGGGDDGAAFE